MASWVALTCGLIALTLVAHLCRKIRELDDTIIFNTHRLERRIMSESQDAVDAVVGQLGKAKDEILAEVADLEAQVAAGVAPDLSALKAAAQALDNLNSDVPVVPPVEPTV